MNVHSLSNASVLRGNRSLLFGCCPSSVDRHRRLVRELPDRCHDAERYQAVKRRFQNAPALFF